MTTLEAAALNWQFYRNCLEHQFGNMHFYHPLIINGTWPALFRVFVFFYLTNVNHSFLSLKYLELFQSDVKVAGVFIFLSMVNLNLMPLKKIIYYCVNNVQIVKAKQTLGLKLSQSWRRPKWVSDVSGFGQAWYRDALCVYIGLLMGELTEAEPIRKPFSRHWSPSVHCYTHCQFMYLMGIFPESQHSSICVNLM